MKTRVFLIAAIFAIAFSQNSLAQKIEPLSVNKAPDLKTDVVGSYPTEVWEYVWNVTMWAIHQQKQISYTSFGEPSEVTIIGDAGDTKTIYSYNSNKMLTEEVHQNKTAGVWVNDRRERYEYNDDNLGSQTLVESWIGGEWILVEGFQDSYDTNQNGDMVVLRKIWSRADNDWINSLRTTNVMGADQQLEESITEGWQDGTWIFMGKWGYVYGDNDSYVVTYYSYVGGEWIPSQRYAYEYDSHGNTVLFKNEVYSGDDWVMWSGTNFILTYDGENLVERITKNTSMTEPGVWKNSYREEFKSFASLSTNPFEINSASISHYPNPAGEYVSLDIHNLDNKYLDIEILDLAGKVLKTDNLFVPVSNYKHVLQLNDMSSGVYIIQAREKSGKLIKSLRVIHEE